MVVTFDRKQFVSPRTRRRMLEKEKELAGSWKKGGFFPVLWGTKTRAKKVKPEVLDSAPKENNQSSRPFVTVSVSGTTFTLPESLLLGQDWILSRIPNGGEVPWGTYHNGQYYIDADSTSFRWVLHFIRYKSVPSEVISVLKNFDAVQRLAEDLSYADLVAYLKTSREIYESELKAAKASRDSKVEGLKAKLDDLSKQLESQSKIVSKMENMDAMTYKCACNTFVSNKFVVLWPQDSAGASSCTCGKCGKQAERVDAWTGKRTVTTVDEFQDWQC